jgi:nitrite reductase/ring-hydroxylating ferredoxin subunit
MAPETTLPSIAKQTWLEPLEEGLQKGLAEAFKSDALRGKPVENALHGVWLGHPLHPALVGIPLGAWTVAFVLDLVEEATGERHLRRGADLAVAVGLAGAAGSAVTGLTDWKDVQGPPRRTGMVHALLNITATALYVASAVQRKRRNRGAGRALAYAGFGLSMTASWLGGHLVFSDQIGVEHKAAAEAPSDFVPVARLTDLSEGKPHRVSHQDYPIVLVREGERVFALAEICSHLGGPLSEGTVEGECIRCPWHGSLFRLEDGEVVESPATRPQSAFEARIHGDQIELRLRSNVIEATETKAKD